MFANRNWTKLLSAAIHTGIVALVFLSTEALAPPKPPRAVVFLTSPIAPYIPPVSKAVSHGGGGGGDRSKTPASLGRLPKAALRQFTPPMAKVNNPDPKLTIEPSLVIDPRMVLPEVKMAQLGLPGGIPGPPSNGMGSGGGIGDGDGGGVGSGSGPGYGPGRGGGMTAVADPHNGRISPAAVLWKVEPEYTEEARKARMQGVVVLNIEVDAVGRARNLRIARSLGLGLDERALEAVSLWKFRPGSQNGKPVATTAQVFVTFRLL
jgi:periplasmic protein TonB